MPNASHLLPVAFGKMPNASRILPVAFGKMPKATGAYKKNYNEKWNIRVLSRCQM